MKKQGKNLRSFNIEEEELEEDEHEETLPRDTGHVHVTMVTETPASFFGGQPWTGTQIAGGPPISSRDTRTIY